MPCTCLASTAFTDARINTPSRINWIPNIKQTATVSKKRGAKMSTTRPNASGANQEATPKTAPLKGVYLLPDGRLMEKMPLSAVVTDAVRRWYLEAERDANRGDVKAMALLGQMLMEGYGCDVDVDQGKKWADRAKRRGYRMMGVYCVL